MDLTTSQNEEIREFETAIESQDLNAIGQGRKFRAHKHVAELFASLMSQGLNEWLTSREKGLGRHSQSYVENAEK